MRKTLENILFLPRVAKVGLTKNIRFDIETSLQGASCIRSDETRLRQIIFNLIGNSIKFTDTGFVCMRLIELAPEDGRISLRFEVENSGIGISPEHSEQLFTPFFQADGSLTRRYGGPGLGLSICSRLVELLGGKIGVDSEVGRGSTFWFTLQVEPGELISEPAALTPPAEPSIPRLESEQKLQVLLVEDNKVNQMVISATLKKLDCLTHVLENGKMAVDLLSCEDKEYDVVLMDVQMPVMDGMEASRTIRALNSKMANIPIIAVTANAMEGDRERYIAAGMDDYIAKPINAHLLIETILKVCRPQTVDLP